MEKTRQRLPAGLAEMPPGPRLAAVLTTIDLSRLSGADCVEVLRARHRQASHEQANLMAAMVEVALCGIGPDDTLPRMDAPDEFSADEIRGALAWTRAAASNQLSYQVRPPLIIPLLPDPIPRDPPGAYAENDHAVEEWPTWQENAAPTPQHPPPASVPPTEPPF